MRSTPEILKAHVPENAIGYATELWRLGNFFFKLSRDRETKLGDYSLPLIKDLINIHFLLRICTK